MKETKSHWQPYILENSKVKLIPLTENDFEALYLVASDPLIWEQHPSPDRYKKEVFREFFDKALNTGTAFVIKDKLSDQVIGSTRYYDYNGGESSITIGFTFLARKYWGGQYNRSVKELMLEYAFSFVNKVIFHVGSENVRSQLATTRFGATKTGEFYKEAGNSKSLTYEYTIQKNREK